MLRSSGFVRSEMGMHYPHDMLEPYELLLHGGGMGVSKIAATGGSNRWVPWIGFDTVLHARSNSYLCYYLHFLVKTHHVFSSPNINRWDVPRSTDQPTPNFEPHFLSTPLITNCSFIASHSPIELLSTMTSLHTR